MRYTRLFESIDKSSVIEKLDQSLFLDLLVKHKALLFRSSENEPHLSVDDFGHILAALNLEPYPYVGGAAPRRIVKVNAPGGDNMIYTANEAPPDQPIPFHHELAQVQNPPEYIFFYCNEPSESGGETALIDSTLVYRFVNDNFPQFMTKLKTHG